MTEEERISKQKELIEKYGNLSKQTGGSGLSGRIIALLSFSDKDEFTFEEIVQELNNSKSSISTALNHLMDLDEVEYVTYAGDRKRYFRIKINTREQLIKSMRRHIEKIRDISSAALDLKKDKESRSAKNIRRLLKDLKFWIKQMDVYEAEFQDNDI